MGTIKMCFTFINKKSFKNFTLGKLVYMNIIILFYIVCVKDDLRAINIRVVTKQFFTYKEISSIIIDPLCLN